RVRRRQGPGQRSHPRRLDPPALHAAAGRTPGQGGGAGPDPSVAVRVPRPMRFFEYEAREIVKRAGIPVTDYGFTRNAAEAKQIAERIGGPTVVKSQVLTGGRMKAGGVKFADTPEEAEAQRATI